jgi:hypothetical protein
MALSGSSKQKSTDSQDCDPEQGQSQCRQNDLEKLWAQYGLELGTVLSDPQKPDQASGSTGKGKHNRLDASAGGKPVRSDGGGDGDPKGR